ncbi:MAG: GIY-YIG nuclease family protein [Armatimonadetes bacterium]|nr:GIY-YIG nuclease family protein [Armatimonadota bacterium]
MAHYVYMLRCSDGSFYVGQTDDLELRLAEHRLGAGSSWTKRRLPVTLVWSSGMPSRDQALAVERQLKGWSRAKKQALVGGDWATIVELARNRQEG